MVLQGARLLGAVVRDTEPWGGVRGEKEHSGSTQDRF